MRSPSIARTSIVTRIALAGATSLLLFAIAMIVFVSRELQQTIYAQTDARVQVAENTMFELIREKGNPTLRDGTLRLGKWVANADNALVDHVHALTGADATLFAVVDGRPIRVTTTIIKLDGSGRNIGPSSSVRRGEPSTRARTSPASVPSPVDRSSTAMRRCETGPGASSASPIPASRSPRCRRPSQGPCASLSPAPASRSPRACCYSTS